MKRILATLAVAASSVLPAVAQEWPSQPVRIIVPFGAGAGTDRVARLMADGLARQTGQSFVVDNRPGADAIAGTEAVVRSRKDGHTLLFTTPALAYSKLLFAKLPYDPEADLRPVGTVGYAPYLLLANNNFPATTPSAIVDLLKREPGKHNYGRIGISNAIGRPKKWPKKAIGRARRGPKCASLGGFSAQSGRLEARGWRVGRSLNVHGAQDWTWVSGSTLMLAMACRHSAQRQRWPACQG